MIPEMDASNPWILPAAPTPYVATFDEIHERFVAGAPYVEERQTVFDALLIYAKLVWRVLPDARLRIDGGFVTHKTWAAPEDVDIAVVCPTISSEQLERAIEAPLFTLMDVSGVVVKIPVAIPKLHVMGGLVDSFPILPGLPALEAVFARLWSTVKGDDGELIPNMTKGYLEVVNPDA